MTLAELAGLMSIGTAAVQFLAGTATSELGPREDGVGANGDPSTSTRDPSDRMRNTATPPTPPTNRNLPAASVAMPVGVGELRRPNGDPVTSVSPCAVT